MPWITTLLILAILIRAITKIYDKHLITSGKWDSDIYAVLTRVYSVVVVVALVLFTGTELTLSRYSILAMLAGLFKFGSLVFFFRCLKTGDAAMTVGLKQSLAFALPLLWVAVLGGSDERLWVAILVVGVVLGLFGLSAGTLNRFIGISKSGLAALAASALLEMVFVGVIALSGRESFVSLFCWSRIGALVAAGLYLLIFKRHSSLRALAGGGRLYTSIKVGLNETAALGAKLLVIYLISHPAFTSGVHFQSGCFTALAVVGLVSLLGALKRLLPERMDSTAFSDIRFSYLGLTLLLVLMASTAMG